MKFFRQGLTIFLVVMLLLTSASASEVSTHGDTVFGSAACFLFADKIASFDFTTYDIKERIVIVNVWLEQQVNGQWVYQKTLPVPAKVATDTVSYCVEYDYSSNINRAWDVPAWLYGRCRRLSNHPLFSRTQILIAFPTECFSCLSGIFFCQRVKFIRLFEPNARGGVTNLLATDISKQGHFAKNDILLVGETLPNPR